MFKPGRVILIAGLWLVGGQLLFAASAVSPSKTGRVISATISGHGPTEVEGKKKVSSAAKKTDIWWTYCISAQGQSYFVLSRDNPEKTGLTKNRWISFSEGKNQIYIVNPRGKRVALRILRKEKSQ